MIQMATFLVLVMLERALIATTRKASVWLPKVRSRRVSTGVALRERIRALDRSASPLSRHPRTKCSVGPASTSTETTARATIRRLRAASSSPEL